MSALSEDTQLLGRLRAGEERAFTELIETFEGRLGAFLRRLLGPGGDVDDALQEVFTRAYLNLGKFRGEVTLESWLYRIARNHAIDRLRRRKSRPEQSVSALNSAEQRFVAEQAPGGDPDPGMRAERNEALQRAWALLEKLPPEDRALLVLKEVEEKSFAEIGEIFGVRVGALKVRLFRARKRLEKIVREREPA